MKTLLFSLSIFLTTCYSVIAQSNGIPAWDFRSISSVQSEIGVCFYWDKQNRGFSGFLRVDYSPYKDFYFNNIGNVDSNNNKYNYFNSSMDARLGFEFEIRRNIKLYDIEPHRVKSDVNSWTYIAELNLNVEVLLRPINSEYYQTLEFSNIRGSVLGLEYSLFNQSNTSIFKYLSNTNGRVSLNYRHLTDKWGGTIFLQNDFWIYLFKKHIRNHDHGSTTKFGMSGYWRFKDKALLSPEQIAVAFRSNEKLFLGYSFDIITDRKIANNTSSAFARLGYYSVRDSSIFHGYSKMSVGFSNGFSKVQVGMLTDDLRLGRNLQRWVHQGTNFRNLKRRKNILGFANKSIYKSDFEFLKDNADARRKFLLQQYFQNQLPEISDSVLITAKMVEHLSDQQILQFYSASEKLRNAFEIQLFVNKYRYKKTRVIEPTPLFPWEGRMEFFRKKRQNIFFHLQAFKRT